MIPIKEIQRRYSIGYITATDAVSMIFRTILDNGEHCLDEINEELLSLVEEYLQEYDPKHGSIGLEPPTEFQVNVAKNWFVSRQKH